MLFDDAMRLLMVVVMMIMIMLTMMAFGTSHELQGVMFKLN